MKCINYLSLLWFSPQFQLGEGGESTMGHTYSSLQLTYTFQTRTKHAKMHEMYKLFIFAAVSLLLPNCEGSQSALFINSNTKIPIRIHPWKPHLARTCSGDGASLSRWPPSFRSGVKDSGIEPQQRIRVTCYTSTRTQSYRHICKCYVTYLLIEW